MTHYTLTPISDKPEEGVMILTTIGPRVFYNGKWYYDLDYQESARTPTEWLKPVTGVLMTEDEIYEMLETYGSEVLKDKWNEPSAFVSDYIKTLNPQSRDTKRD